MQHIQMGLEYAFENMFRKIKIYKLLHEGNKLNFQYLLYFRKLNKKIL